MSDDIQFKSRKLFDSWFEIFAEENEIENKERLYHFFYSGYLAGTKYSSQSNPRSNPNIIIDDVSRNLDL